MKCPSEYAPVNMPRIYAGKYGASLAFWCGPMQAREKAFLWPKLPANNVFMKIFIALFVAVLLAVSPVGSHAVAGPKTNLPPAKALSAQDQRDLQRIENYLNSMKTLQGRILQQNADGTTIGGTLKIQRPGKLRLDYDAPAKSFLVADGLFVHYWDDSLRQTSSVPQGGSPAALILDAQIDLSKNMTITELRRGSGLLEVTVYKTDDPANGTLTLVFNDAGNELRIRQWHVRDAQGSTTRVSLTQVDQAVTFKSGDFTYRPPQKPAGSR